jgi:hypothetical protein
MNRTVMAVATLGMFVAACGPLPTSPAASKVAQAPLFSKTGGGNGVAHHVSAGGPDACAAPGCNGNFSLVANQYADGSVSGQWEDSFGHGDGGFHIAVDCVAISGNAAVVGGVITHAIGADNLVGLRAVTEVVDNGTSANDPPDQISYTYYGNYAPGCGQTDFALLDLNEGQVTVK